MTGLAETPDPPYVAVIFTSHIRLDSAGYGDMAKQMSTLVLNQPGFLGMESARDERGFGVTISYWRDLEAVAAWRSHPAHREARRQGKKYWYQAYRVRICEVQREYGFETKMGV